MTRCTSRRLLAAEHNTQQILLSIHSWRQAGLAERASRCLCEKEIPSGWQEERGRRLRSTGSSFLTLSIILCAAMIPSAFCTYIAPEGIMAAKYRHSVSADMLVSGGSKLKKSVSFSCKMDQAVIPRSPKTSAELQDVEYSSNVYTPVHSSSDLESTPRVQSMRLRGQDGFLASSSTSSRRSLTSGDVASAPYVYTRLQTKLFPQMRF
jgi:hypothetical protein